MLMALLGQRGLGSVWSETIAGRRRGSILRHETDGVEQQRNEAEKPASQRLHAASVERQGDGIKRQMAIDACSQLIAS